MNAVSPAAYHTGMNTDNLWTIYCALRTLEQQNAYGRCPVDHANVLNGYITMVRPNHRDEPLFAQLIGENSSVSGAVTVAAALCRATGVRIDP